jgi:hypothetical protein
MRSVVASSARRADRARRQTRFRTLERSHAPTLGDALNASSARARIFLPHILPPQVSTMAIPLLELIQSQFSSPVVRQISSLLRESEPKTREAIASGAPVLVAGLIQQAASSEGSRSLALTLDTLDVDFLKSLDATLSTDVQHNYSSTGTGMLASLFGSRQHSIVAGLSQETGLPQASTETLLATMAPIVLGVSAVQKKQLGLDSKGLAAMLTSQASAVAPRVVPTLRGTLGLATDSRPTAVAPPVPTVTRMSEVGRSASRRVHPMLSRFAPFLLLVLFGALVWRFIASRSESSVLASSTTQIQNAQGKAIELFGSATHVLSTVRDPDSARSALPKLQAISFNVAEFSPSLADMPTNVRESVAKIAETLLASLRAVADKALTAPGVDAILRPTVERLFEALTKLER